MNRPDTSLKVFLGLATLSLVGWLSASLAVRGLLGSLLRLAGFGETSPGQ